MVKVESIEKVKGLGKGCKAVSYKIQRLLLKLFYGMNHVAQLHTLGQRHRDGTGRL